MRWLMRVSVVCQIERARRWRNVECQRNGKRFQQNTRVGVPAGEKPGTLSAIDLHRPFRVVPQLLDPKILRRLWLKILVRFWVRCSGRMKE